MNFSDVKQASNSYYLEQLAELFDLSKEKLLEKMNFKLVDLGVDSLQISALQNFFDPSPSLLVLYNSNVEYVLNLLEKTGVHKVQTKLDDPQKETQASFELLEMQESYYIGRFESERFVPCQVYSEFDFEQLDIEAFNQAIDHVVQKHPMLRAHVVDGHFQEIRSKTKFGEIFAGVSIEKEEVDLEKRRHTCMNAFRNQPDCFWNIQATGLPNGAVRLHVLLDMIFLDAASTFIVIGDLFRAYNCLKNQVPLEDLNNHSLLEFSEYCSIIQSLKESDESREYWNRKLDLIPDPPQLPRAQLSSSPTDKSFKRVSMNLKHEMWTVLKKKAQQLQVTPSALILSAFTQVLETYSTEPSFTVTITIANRNVGGKSFSNVVGDFTNVILLDVNPSDDFEEKIKQIHCNMSEALSNRTISGLKVMRLLREKRSDPFFILPVVYTSLLGIDVMPISDIEIPSMVYQQTMTPQVWLDHQVYEIGPDREKELRINWDYDEMFYSSQLVEEMFQVYKTFLENISQEFWSDKRCLAPLPTSVCDLRSKMNNTEKKFEGGQLLHERFEINAKKYPNNIAVVDQEFQLTYGELDRMVDQTTAMLQKNNVKQGDIVAVIMEKGWEQVVGVLSILRAGGTYLPINPSDPDNRIAQILGVAGNPTVLSQNKLMNDSLRWKSFEHQIVLELSVESIEKFKNEQVTQFDIDPSSLAYIIFTSGSEGAPKGVEISHRGATNTCLDINERLALIANDSVFAISSLSFDLSVWDIFGVLSVGGKVVICKPDGTRDPEYWLEQLQKHRVTIWNTVPTSFEMLLEAVPAESTELAYLKQVLLSGDAIKMEFVRLVKFSYPKVRILCLGGATEASIWSCIHEIIPCKSTRENLVPYGVALSNQTMYVLDCRNLERSAYSLGNIYIGGVGLARGYFRDTEKTSKSFVFHPRFGRLYNTGDAGYYLQNGEIQIVGRCRDNQVKIGGHRVELGEIENCVEQISYVKKATVLFIPRRTQKLIGFVQLEKDIHIQNDQIMRELTEKVATHLPDYMAVTNWKILESIPMNSNLKVDRVKLAQLAAELDNSQNTKTERDDAEQNELESTLLNIAQELLNDTQKKLNTTTSLIEFGMTSLMAIRFSKKLSDQIKRKLPYTLVFNYSTIKQIAQMIAGNSTNLISNFINETEVEVNSSHVPIAIVGMACRLPGGSNNPDEFWSMLSKNQDCVTDSPLSRFNINEIYDPNPNIIGKSYTKKGAFINNVDCFDNEFFNIPLSEAKSMDPQQRLFLEVSYEAFHNAGYDKSKLMNSNTGVFVGQMNYDWMSVCENPQTYAGTGTSPSITANRVSFCLGLHGPSMTVDTACSSSLVAVDLAVEKLRRKKCSVALAGGVNIMLNLEPYLITCAAKMLSIDGRCATFDSKANGIVRGEGVGCIVLKRLEQAQADGDHILAVIRGTAVNQDGKSATLTAPSGLAQEALIRSALRDARVEGKDIDYVECHGTGTSLGDPIEIEALKKVLEQDRKKPVILGAVKTNVGHLEGAAGITGLIKTVLVLQHSQVPANIHFETLNPKINMDQFNAIIPTKMMDISVNEDKEVLAGVSSFGFGGTNAHVILQSYFNKSNSQEIFIPKTISWNKKLIPWKRPVLLPEAIKSNDTEKGILENLYKVEWMPVRQLTETIPNEISLQSLTKSRFLILSLKQFLTNGTKWVNICHSLSEGSLKLADILQSNRMANLTDSKYLEKLLVNESWSRIILFIHSEQDNKLAFDIAVRLLMAIQSAYILRNHSTTPEVWFMTSEFSSSSDYRELWTLARTARIEMPEINLKCIEYSKINDTNDLAKHFYKAKTEFKDNEQEVKISDGIFVRRLVKFSSNNSSEKIRKIVANSTYVISGGLGSLGLVLLEWLVNSGATHIALLSRTSSKEQMASVEKIIVNNKKVFINWIQCNVSNLEEVIKAKELINTELSWPQVNGVFHTSGELFDSTIRNIDLKLVHESFSAKVEGARNLYTILSPCDLMILFSSLTSVIGFAGQALYSSANSAMDALADNWNSDSVNSGQKCKVLSIQWSAWSEVGMAAKNKQMIQRLESQGFNSITNFYGIQVLEYLLENDVTGSVCVALFDFNKLVFTSPFLNEISKHSGELEKSKLKRDYDYDSIDDVKTVVNQIIFDILGKEITETTPLMEAGISSLEVISLHQTLVDKFKDENIHSSIVFNYPTALELSRFIYNQIQESKSKQSQSSINELYESEWQKLNPRTSGTPIFLVGGVLGTAEGTFGKLAHTLPSPVYALIPDLSDENASIESISGNLICSIKKLHPDGKYIVGGLSFGCVIALEIACQLEELDQVEALLLFDPRHLPPFVLPENPAKFEQLVAKYTPKVLINSCTILVKALLPDFSKLSSLLKEASRSFQQDYEIENNCKLWCSNITIVNCKDHHFNFLNENHLEIAKNLLQSNIKWKTKKQQKLDEHDPIVIVALSCRMPGCVTNPDQFWTILNKGCDCVSEIPISRFDMDKDVLYSEQKIAGKSYVRKAAFISNAEWFDHEFFNISRAEAIQMDPQQRILLELAYETFNKVGYTKEKLKGLNAGVFVGQANYDWMTMKEVADNSSPYYGPGSSPSITANRISYTLGLEGPCMTVDTACSSSLVAFDMAVSKLKEDNCQMALVAGVNLILDSKFFITGSAMQAFSINNRCATFDASADGYCRGEGVGCVLLKRQSKAKVK